MTKSFSLADNAPVSNHLDITLGQLGYEGHDVRRAGHSFLSKSLTETWRSNAPKARPVCIENIIKGQPGPTSCGKQRVSTDNAVVGSFFVFFSQRMLEHVLDCTKREGSKVKCEDWNAINVLKLKAKASPMELSVKIQRNFPRS